MYFLKLRFVFHIFFSVTLSSYALSDNLPSYNSFGSTGLIQLPTSETRGEGSLSLTFTKNDIYKFGTLTATPFNWLEASYFYYRPSDIFWTDASTAGKYLDKGFNVKFLLKPYKNTNFSIGLDDFAGWGYFSKEYFMTTTSFKSLKISTGIGWGAYSDLKGYKNPFSYIDTNFIDRPITSERYSKGGTLSYDRWFKGRSSIIGGFEYIMPNRKFSIKVEYDPFDYINGLSSKGALGTNPIIREKDSNINYGINYQFNRNFQFGVSFVKGNTLNFNFTLGEVFTKKNSVKKIETKSTSKSHSNNIDPKLSFYEDLLHNFNSNQIFLQTADINNNNLNVAVSSDKYRSPIKLAKYSSEIANEVASIHEEDINRINITNLNVGIELNKIGLKSSDLEISKNPIYELVVLNSNINPGKGKNFLKNDFRPNLKLPAFFTNSNFNIVNHIGDPAKFYYGGINFNINSEIQFTRSLIFTNELSLVLYNNFDEKRNFPDSLAPNVRTEVVNYLQESDDLFFSRMQLDYFFSPYQETFVKVSSGIFEDMYGGIGLEALYKPFYKNYSIGFELYGLKKRSYERQLKFLDYKVNTGHLNFNYYHSTSGVIAKLSAGHYLAGDRGYTIDLSRKLKSGFRAGFFFSRTNMDPITFGEGSFNKGFYFQIPLDFFSKNYNTNYYNFEISPLTRDGGAKLRQGNKLEDIIHSSSYSEIYEHWKDFLN